jgi:hypothetical protein
VLSKGNTRYILCVVTLVAGLLASLGGSWFDGT